MISVRIMIMITWNNRTMAAIIEDTRNSKPLDHYKYIIFYCINHTKNRCYHHTSNSCITSKTRPPSKYRKNDDE